MISIEHQGLFLLLVVMIRKQLVILGDESIGTDLTKERKWKDERGTGMDQEIRVFMLVAYMAKEFPWEKQSCIRWNVSQHEADAQMARGLK